MKINNFKIVAATLLISLTSGCANQILNIDDLSNYPADKVWNDEKMLNAYITDIYPRCFSGWPAKGDEMADEMKGIFVADAITPNTDNYKPWYYTDIRRINTMLVSTENSTIRQENLNVLRGQAYFMRAQLYFRMVFNYGGVPIITAPQDTDDANLFVTRNTTQECFDFIVKDLDEAIKLLPEKHTGNDYGRLDASYALAYKAKVLLAKASPIFHPSAPYSNTDWQIAYETNLAAKTTLENRGYGLLDNYSEVFTTDEHKESVFAVIYSAPNKTNGRNEAFCRPLEESKNATGGDQVCWEFVMKYPMLDGKEPGESLKYNYDLQTYWQNRDPRFEQSLVYNGSIYEVSGKKGRRQYLSGGLGLNNVSDFVSEAADRQRTGFFPLKGMNPSLSVEQLDLSGYDYHVMRFAEVLFNFAECAVEVGKEDEAYDVLKMIRKRAGIEPGLDNMYGLKVGMSREELRRRVLEDKHIEFVFEDVRLSDLRRHRLLSVINGMRKSAIKPISKLTKKQEYSAEEVIKAQRFELLPEEFEYILIDVNSRESQPKVNVVPETYILFPIGDSHIRANPNLKQNSNWGGEFNPFLD